MRRRLILALVPMFVAILVAGCGGRAAAPKYPTKPIEMTVLFGAGSSADLVARQLASGLEKVLGQPVAVVNRTGAGGAVGYNYVKTKPADGYSIVWNSNSISTAYYAGNMKLTYKDFDPVAQVSVETATIAVAADSPWKTLPELIEYARQNPGKVRIGNSGNGSYTHLTAAALAKAAGIEVIHVPFGQGLAVSSLLGGKIEASVQLPAEIMSQYQAGKVRILAVTDSERDPALPDVPTAKEQGVDLVMNLWRGVAAPSGTPKEVIQVLEGAIQKVVTSDEFKEASKKLSFRPAFLGAQDFGKLIADDDARIGQLMADLGLRKTQ
ncbi:Bug family tripartite tricarboxylate transporter substrate binding protein [Caldinitratiruptor microaerophilus]|uniref:ABC transporter substrate-binding protein n=1 Tax=Caldinitratiruptor microaerophilus TaxID=671077 RepID=A0AA35G5J9_9FIRM|nr:tripartite tricarboxylate transporter substrate binding protein [Caldinitratiruptor microaerophilus]BDG59551.1 ABC transporter substrate-binding protein [Caldinitratiruptor microaerophilus]